jgi:hypothetical protein
VIEAIDHFLGFFLALFAVTDGGAAEKPVKAGTKSNAKAKKPKGGARGKTAAH